MKKKFFSILITFSLVLTMIPFATAEVSAASYLKTLNASSTETTVSLSWNKLTKKQMKKVSGIAVFRNGVAVKNLNKKSNTYKDTGLASGTTYTYQIKTYKTSKTKMWYNKATGNWQKKKPAKKNRGKSKKVTTYKYSNASPARNVSTVAVATVDVTTTTPTTPTESTTTTIQPPYFVSVTPTVDNNSPEVFVKWAIPITYASMTYILYRDGEKYQELAYNVSFYHDRNVGWSETHTYKIAAVRNGVEVSSDEVTVTTSEETTTTEPTVDDGDWMDVSDAYGILNEFRMSEENQWYLAKDGSTTYLTDMYELTRDEQFEELAEARAKERWTAYYINGESGHNGVNLAYSDINWTGECLAYSHDYTSRETIFGKTNANEIAYNGGWAETTKNYAGQGHRRIMLTQTATKCGIACYQVYRNGHYDQTWVLVVGN